MNSSAKRLQPHIYTLFRDNVHCEKKLFMTAEYDWASTFKFINLEITYIASLSCLMI